ncbi:hypothetical protein HOY82DRAFT_489015 [Tuber indicum]|nr:hypothetical protein HOY82DRAFT_489015 [Tuber indicum]
MPRDRELPDFQKTAEYLRTAANQFNLFPNIPVHQQEKLSSEFLQRMSNNGQLFATDLQTIAQRLGSPPLLTETPPLAIEYQVETRDQEHNPIMEQLCNFRILAQQFCVVADQLELVPAPYSVRIDGRPRVMDLRMRIMNNLKILQADLQLLAQCLSGDPQLLQIGPEIVHGQDQNSNNQFNKLSPHSPDIPPMKTQLKEQVLTPSHNKDNGGESTENLRLPQWIIWGFPLLFDEKWLFMDPNRFCTIWESAGNII